jgi:hypothetical protein
VVVGKAITKMKTPIRAADISLLRIKVANIGVPALSIFMLCRRSDRYRILNLSSKCLIEPRPTALDILFHFLNMENHGLSP